MGEVSPIFVADINTLKARLRLNGAGLGDVQAIINGGVVKARLFLYKRLTKQIIDRVLATTEVENPSTDDEIKRSQATEAEIFCIKAQLIRDLPMMALEASAAVRQAWNEEGLTRTLSLVEIDKQYNLLMAEVENFCQAIIGDVESSQIQIGSTPSRTYLPGEAIFGNRGIMGGLRQNTMGGCQQGGFCG